MRYEPFDAAFFTENRARLSARLPRGAVAIVHSHDLITTSADGSLPFRQNSDFFYLTGIEQEESVLILDPSAAEVADRERLFLRETSDLIRIWEGDRLTREQAVERSGVTRVDWTDGFEPALRRLLRQRKTVFLNANEHPRSGAELFSRDDRLLQRI